MNRFETGNPDNWSAPAWDILDRFQHAYLREEMIGTRNFVDDIICMFSLAGWERPALFEQVLATDDSTLVQRLWSEWCRGVPSVWITTFWDTKGAEDALAFYTSPAVMDGMLDIALSPETDPACAKKAWALVSTIKAYQSSTNCFCKAQKTSGSRPLKFGTP